MKITTIRRLSIALGFVLVLVGLAFHTGSGTLSSFGYQYIAEICPLGALETFLAAKMLVPRTVVAFLLMIVGVLLLGRAFCSWLCPVPPLRHFFHPAKKKQKPKKAVETDATAPLATAVAATPVAADAADDPEGRFFGDTDDTEGRFFCVPGNNIDDNECSSPGTQKNRP
ncbi:MAG: 4Fe-4S binding protein, partial [Coriobacteriales bacterium]|nr:4Fe-4S binding protein [Coriobacteriales bacterium]